MSNFRGMESKKPLIIAEKPSAARAVADALGGFQNAGTHLESAQYMLSWALGHLVELWEPEDYDPRWRRWSLGNLPIVPAAFRVKVIQKTRAQFETLRKLERRASGLINACDAGREGELIFRYVVEAMGAGRLPVRRLWVSSLTREAIRKGFAALQPQSAYDRLYASAVCRARGDWLVGMNATRAFTARFGELLSVGRVQTPTLALLVRRELEIRAFQSEPYWEVTAAFQPEAPLAVYTGKWFGPAGDRLPDAETAAAVVARVRAAGRGQVAARTEQETSERPPQLFDLTSLQRDANRRYGLTAAATLKAAQQLYEAKLITYPRTDSRYLTRDMARTVVRPLKALARLPEYQSLAAGADLERIWNGRVVNDARVTDHHAIIPTGEAIGALTGAPARVFDLVARRFLAQFYPEARFLEVDLITAVGPDTFRSRGKQVLQEGWRVVEPPAEPRGAGRSGRGKTADAGAGRGAASAAGAGAADPGDAEEAAAVLPAVREGDPVAVQEVAAVRKETQPPRRFTEAMLLGAMESAGKEMEEEALREAMKGRGLGTPATRAATIERLKQVGYIETRGKLLVPTEKGERLVRLAGAVGSQVLLSADLTGEWEKRIADIQGGHDDPERLLAAMQELATQVVDQVRTAGTAVGDTGAAAPDTGGGGPGPAAEDAALLADTAGAGVRAGTCPLCGGTVARTSRDWRCAGAGCELRIPGFLCGKPLGPDVAGILLREGRTQLIAGFVSPRTGKSFSAYLVLQGPRVGFEFPPRGAAQRGKRGARKAAPAKGGRRRAPEAQG